MSKNVTIKPNAILLNQYYSKYGYWSRFWIDYLPITETSFTGRPTIDDLQINGFEVNSSIIKEAKSILQKFNILTPEIIDNFSLMILIIKATTKRFGEYTLAEQLRDTKEHFEELIKLKDLVSKHEQFSIIEKRDNGKSEVKNYQSEFEAKINLTYKGKAYKFEFTDGNIRMALFRAFEQHIKDNASFYNIYKNDNTYPTIYDLTKQNKVNTPNKDNDLINHRRRVAKATFDLFSQLNINLTQNKKAILIGRLFELGGLIESEIEFNNKISPSTNYKAIGLKSTVTPYEKFLQQNIKKFIKEFEPS